jgi:NAD(P)-dependent dehydrogenase (short-subunit alcohol dehydrogenase family)
VRQAFFLSQEFTFMQKQNIFDLTGRVAMVTGGGRGIGREIATTLAEAGASIAIAELDPATGEQAASDIGKIGGETMAIQMDVRNPESVDAGVQQFINRFGKIDILIANAGIVVNTPAESTSTEEWLNVININLNGVFWSCRAVGKHMLVRKSGSIVNVGSMSGSIVNKPQPQAAYNASKAAVIHLTRSLAAEWADRGVRVNSISPGYIGTEMTKRGMNNAEWAKTWLEMTPMGRVGTPKEIAWAVLYLVSDAATFVTGTDLIVDGGYTVW